MSSIEPSKDVQGATGAVSGSPPPIPNIPLTHRPWVDQPSQAALSAIRTRKVVLVVEDDLPMLGLLVQILESENFEVYSAATGEAALELVDHDGLFPDLLITDLMMPGCSGIELASAMRERTPHLRVLYETGYADELFVGRQELEEHAAFLEKPFSPRGLIEAARLALFDTINPE